MADKKASSDNPWAEMSRLNLAGKEAKSPNEVPKTPIEKVVNTTNDAIVSASVNFGTVSATPLVEEVEYSLEQLEEMSVKELQLIAQGSGIDTDGLSKEELIAALSADEVALSVENQEDEEEIILEEDDESLESEEIDGEMSLEEALALLGEDSDTEEDFSDVEFEEVEMEVQEGDVSFELDDNNPNNV